MCSWRNIAPLLFLFLLPPTWFIAQEKVLVEDIILEGNRKTKDKTIFRESRILIGDSILLASLSEVIKENQNQILSTGLFNSVTTQIDTISYDRVRLRLDITENWYLYPSPLFELADRNFNVWWQEQNKDFSRTIYGLDISHYNLTGRRDPLKIRAHAGYTRKLEMHYTFPFIHRNWGLAGNIFYSDNRELGYKTENNKTLFSMHPDEEIMLQRRRVGFRLLNRPNVFTHHSFRLEFHHNTVNEYVVETLNDNYFLNGRNGIRFFYFVYDFQYDKRDYSNYPRKGFLFGLNFKKEGLFIFDEFNNTSLSLSGEYFLPIPKEFILGWQSRVKANLDRSVVSYANNTGLGWGGYSVTGFDLYVLDGTDFFILKNSVKRTVFQRTFQLPKRLPTQFRKLPIEINLRFNYDVAYVNEPTYLATNDLNNRWIQGFGPTVDLILFNNFLFSFEYGINDLGERGFFLHNSTAF